MEANMTWNKIIQREGFSGTSYIEPPALAQPQSADERDATKGNTMWELQKAMDVGGNDWNWAN